MAASMSRFIFWGGHFRRGVQGGGLERMIDAKAHHPSCCKLFVGSFHPLTIAYIYIYLVYIIHFGRILENYYY